MYLFRVVAKVQLWLCMVLPYGFVKKSAVVDDDAILPDPATRSVAEHC
jgi:hypothetical protein